MWHCVLVKYENLGLDTQNPRRSQVTSSYNPSSGRRKWTDPRDLQANQASQTATASCVRGGVSKNKVDVKFMPLYMPL